MKSFNNLSFQAKHFIYSATASVFLSCGGEGLSPDWVDSNSLAASVCSGLLSPKNLSFDSATGTSINIKWEDSSFASCTYDIQACAGSSCSDDFIVSSSAISELNASSYEMTGLTEGEYYTFRVRSTGAGDSEPWLSSEKVLMFGTTTVSDVGNGGIDLSSFPCTDSHLGKTYGIINFPDSTEVSRYDIYRVEDGVKTLLESVSSGGNSVTLTGLDADASYSLLVKAIGADGTQSLNEMTSDFTSGKFVYCNVIGGSTLRASLQDRLNVPRNMFIYNNKLFVSDTSHNRVLIWNSLPSSSSDLPDVVVGQIDFSGARANGEGGARHASGFNGPNGLWAGMIGGQEKLLVTDTNNHRVLVFDGIPTSNNPQASVVLGQVNAYAGLSTCDSSTFKNPYGVYSDGTKIYVADTAHNRIAI